MTIEATPAHADANSYLTVAEADALAGDDLGPEPTSWLAAETDQKERALKRATREIDARLREQHADVSERPLLIPRGIDVDADDEPYIPRAVKLATYQQAIYVLKNATVLAAANTRRARNMESASEPEISYSQGADAGAVLSLQAIPHLERFLRSGRGIRSVRLVPVEDLE